MEKNKALETLIQISNNNLGFIPSTPAEFNNLSTIIFDKTKSRISTSSIKRLWGYVSYSNFPSRTTLNILARFNDFKDWDTFINEIAYTGADTNSTSGFVDGSLVNASSLNIGDIIDLKWAGDKECSLQYISYLRFKVLDCKNIKLIPSDTCTINSICLGMPLFISNIQRQGIIIPGYVGAKAGGILSIHHHPAKPIPS